jgi:hypothetical protein
MVTNDSVVCAELDAELVLLDVETGVYFGLNEVGASIWKLLAEGATEAEIFTRLLGEYEVEPAELRSDLSRFLALLAEKGLVRVAAE